MTLTEQEKIQKAEEIYYRRNGLNYRTEREQNSHPTKSHPIRNIILIMMIIGAGFAYSNKEMLTSPEFHEQVKMFLNTKINIKDIFSLEQIKQENTTNDTQPEQQSVQPNTEQLAENIEAKQENQEAVVPETIAPVIPEPEKYEVVWPHKGEITSDFGTRESEDSRVTGNHTGIDIAGNLGDKIVSAIDGKVIEVSGDGMLGNHVKIENEKIITVYAHCNNIYVKEGDEIKQGQEIGEVGSTGNSTGNHLHFETIKGGEYIDPMTVIENNTAFAETIAQQENNKEGEVWK